MKVGIISDTHDRLESIERARDIFTENEVEMILHCGDWVSPYTLDFFVNEGFRVPIKGVIGNVEGDLKNFLEINKRSKNPVEFPTKQTLDLNIDGKKAIIYHGQDKNLLEALIKSDLYDVVFTGHTHQVRNYCVGKTLVLNPGSTSFSSKGKITKKASVAIYNSDSNSAKIVTFSKDNKD